MSLAERRFQGLGDGGEGHRFLALGHVVTRGGTADDDHEPGALDPDEHVGVHVSGGAADLVDLELLRRVADQDRDLAVAVPAEGRDAGGQLVVVLARQDRVDDERFEPGVPQPAGLGGTRVDVGGAKAMSREYFRIASCSISSSFARSSTTVTTTRMSCSVCCRLTERRSSRGAEPKTSAAAIHGVDAVPSSQEMNDVMPAWATSPTADRRPGGISLYQGSVSSSRLIVAVESSPDTCRSQESARSRSLSWLAAGAVRGVLTGGSGLSAGAAGGPGVDVVQAVLVDRLLDDGWSTLPCFASCCSVRTTTEGPSMWKKRRAAGRVSEKPKPSAPSVA